MHRPKLCFKQPLAKGLIPFNRTVPVRPRSYASNMGSRNVLSYTLRWSPMPGVAFSTTLLDPLQWPGACNGCNLVKLRSEFWQQDLQQTARAKHKLLCKSCRPTPPGQRRPQYKCRSCELDKPREEYWQEDLDNRTSSRKLVCKGCRPEPPEQREPRERQYTCSTCKVQKPRDDYWLEDFDNRAITKRLVCKVCRPTPPAQRQQQHHQKGQARSKSAGAVLSHPSD